MGRETFLETMPRLQELYMSKMPLMYTLKEEPT